MDGLTIKEVLTVLILSRRVGETFCIGDEIIVTVLGVKSNQGRIGINSSKDMEVYREEAYRRIRTSQALEKQG